MTATVRIETAPRTRGYPTAWWGMAILVMTEGMIFLALLSAYFFVRASSPHWPIGGLPPPELVRSSIFTVFLLGSSIPIFWMEASVKRGKMAQVKAGLLLSFLMGAAFLGNTAYDFTHMEFGWRVNAYSSLFHTIVGLHAIHVLVGLLMSLVVQAKVWTGRVSRERHVTPDVFALYWHFVDGVWIFVFGALFLSVHLV
ncbi:MAG TPA: cytochrome c oxidase subunit 3 [Acidimicrobiia bacterium]|jgi:heme/copper-type cytochrome/quinol oxidase subunit 3